MIPLGRSTTGDLILIFRGTHQVLSAEKHLKKGGVAMRLIPVPRPLASDCGLAIRIAPALRARARELLSAAALLPASAHILRPEGGYDTVPF